MQVEAGEVPQFVAVPAVLSIQIKIGPYENYCGFVAGTDGTPVLVGVFKRDNADHTVRFQPPALGYLERAVSTHPDVVCAEIKGWRLPSNEDELRALVSALIAS